MPCSSNVHGALDASSSRDCIGVLGRILQTSCKRWVWDVPYGLVLVGELLRRRDVQLVLRGSRWGGWVNGVSWKEME